MITIDLKEASEALEKIKNLLKVNELSFEGSYNYYEEHLDEFCFTNSDVYDDHADVLDDLESRLIIDLCKMIGSRYAEDPAYASIKGYIDLTNANLTLTKFYLSYEIRNTDSDEFAGHHDLVITEGWGVRCLNTDLMHIASSIKDTKTLSTATVKITL
jgi:hypothetical protein